MRRCSRSGAQAAQIGTAFLACEESGAPAAHRALLFTERTRSTVLARAFTGPLARGLENWWTRELASRIAELPPWIAELPPFPIPSWFVGQLRAAALAAGATDVMSPWIGRIAPNLVHRGASALLDAPW